MTSPITWKQLSTDVTGANRNALIAGRDMRGAVDDGALNIQDTLTNRVAMNKKYEDEASALDLAGVKRQLMGNGNDTLGEMNANKAMLSDQNLFDTYGKNFNMDEATALRDTQLGTLRDEVNTSASAISMSGIDGSADSVTRAIAARRKQAADSGMSSTEIDKGEALFKKEALSAQQAISDRSFVKYGQDRRMLDDSWSLREPEITAQNNLNNQNIQQEIAQYTASLDSFGVSEESIRNAPKNIGGTIKLIQEQSGSSSNDISLVKDQLQKKLGADGKRKYSEDDVNHLMWLGWQNDPFQKGMGGTFNQSRFEDSISRIETNFDEYKNARDSITDATARLSNQQQQQVSDLATTRRRHYGNAEQVTPAEAKKRILDSTAENKPDPFSITELTQGAGDGTGGEAEVVPEQAPVDPAPPVDPRVKRTDAEIQANAKKGLKDKWSSIKDWYGDGPIDEFTKWSTNKGMPDRKDNTLAPSAVADTGNTTDPVSLEGAKTAATYNDYLDRASVTADPVKTIQERIKDSRTPKKDIKILEKLLKNMLTDLG
jgi:hypothetical protein